VAESITIANETDNKVHNFGNMTSGQQRFTTPHDSAVGIAHYAPHQEFFRETNAVARWATDPTSATSAKAFHMKCHEDGTVDVIALQSGMASWYDGGGQGAYDVKAGRI
jgi:hypothetical protein